jgi:hypothetical protein
MFFQLLLLLLIVVGIALAVWAFVSTTPKKDNGKGNNSEKDNGKGNNSENNGNDDDKGNNSKNDDNNDKGGKQECKWKEYAGQDNNGVSPCDDDKCRMQDTTEEECKKACCEMDGCKSVQWRSTDGRCLLKNSVGDINDAAKEKTLFVKE